METIKEARIRLDRKRKRIQFLYIIHAEIYAVAVIVGMLRYITPAVVLAAANMLFYVLYLRRITSALSEEVVAANVLYGVCGPLKGASFLGRTGMTAEELAALAMFPLRVAKKSLLLKNGFAGKNAGLLLKGWELAFHYPVQKPGGKAEYRFLSGTLLTAERQSSAGGAGENWLLLRKELLEQGARDSFLEQHGYRPATYRSGILEKNFDLYSQNNANVPAELTQRLERLSKRAENLGAVRLTSAAAAVYLDKSFYTVRTRLRFSPDEAWLRHNFLTERESVWEFFRSCLRLY